MAGLEGLVFLTLVLVLATIPGVVPVKTFDCLLKFKGEYSGKISVTMSGYTCQRWDATCPSSKTTKFTDADFPDVSKSAASNYCRNPKSGLEDHPWCYIADHKAPKSWDYCHVPYCTRGTECVLSPTAAEYSGTHSVATDTDGKKYTCQRWDSQSPNAHSRKAGGVHLNEDTLSEAENYCRNPLATESKPWCYTIGGIRWAYCDITPPVCATTKICSNPPTVEHAVQLTPTAAGPYDHQATATYKCNTGYEFADENDGVECLLSGQWSEKPVCVKAKCPTLELDTPAAVAVEGDPDEFGTTVTYTCEEGFKHTGGDLNIKCQSDKTWNGAAPTCTRIDCGTAPIVPGATLELTTSTTFGGVARYTCDKDKLTYEKICKEDGKWNGTICSGTPVGVITVAASCSTEDPVLVGLIICSSIGFFTVLGLSIAVCKLKHAASAATEIPGKPGKPGAKSMPKDKYKQEQPRLQTGRNLTTAHMEQYGHHHYYRDLY